MYLTMIHDAERWVRRFQLYSHNPDAQALYTNDDFVIYLDLSRVTTEFDVEQFWHRFYGFMEGYRAASSYIPRAAA